MSKQARRDRKESGVEVADLPAPVESLAEAQAAAVEGGAVKLENVQITSYQLGAVEAGKDQTLITGFTRNG